MLETLGDSMRAAIFLELDRIGWNKTKAQNQLIWQRERPVTAEAAPSRRLAEVVAGHR